MKDIFPRGGLGPDVTSKGNTGNRGEQRFYVGENKEETPRLDTYGPWMLVEKRGKQTM